MISSLSRPLSGVAAGFFCCTEAIENFFSKMCEKGLTGRSRYAIIVSESEGNTMKDWIWDLVLGLAFMATYLGGFAAILYICYLYLFGLL